MVSACLEARARVTGDALWATHARRAFDWFLGQNQLQRSLYDPATGGCRDGLHADRANENQGAESTLSFLLALVEMRGVDRAGRARHVRMRGAGYETLFRRASARTRSSAPIGWPYPAHTVFNPAPPRLADGTTLLLCRVEDRRGHLAPVRRALGQRRRRLGDRPGADVAARSGEPSRGAVGRSRIRASPTSTSWANTPSPTPPSAGAGPAWRWR